MRNVSSVRITAPKAIPGEIERTNLVNTIVDSEKSIAYIQAGAGYGKTTLLSQISKHFKNTVWCSIAGESDLFSFVGLFYRSVHQQFPNFIFNESEYIPFASKDNFIEMLANAFIEKLYSPDACLIVFDDVHTINEPQIKEFISSFLKQCQNNIKICFGSREICWPGLLCEFVILQLTQKDLAFSKEDVKQILGLETENIYSITEGWPIAIVSLKVLIAQGIDVDSLPSHLSETMYSYLFHEYIHLLPPDMIEFLKASSCFEELNPAMLNSVLNRSDAKLLLKKLVSQNLFTAETINDHFSYHALFKESLNASVDIQQKASLQLKAAQYYFAKKDYDNAAHYALLIGNNEILQNTILACLDSYLSSGKYNQLQIWFKAIGEEAIYNDTNLLLGYGTLMSSIGNFTTAKKSLDTVIPRLQKDDKYQYLIAIAQKARVLRNFVSFEDSNKLLDELICDLDGEALETYYIVVIEKLYNLCWLSNVDDALKLAFKMIDKCTQEGNLKVKSWFERYLCPIYFYMGNMTKAVEYYENSLRIPDIEQQFLEKHCIGIYAAKAYQMLGNRETSLTLISAELQKLKDTSNFEDMWVGYLLAAEINYQNNTIDRMNGKYYNFDMTKKLFTTANEYAPLYRKTNFQIAWSRIQQLTYNVLFTKERDDASINEIFASLDNTSDYFKCIVASRLLEYFTFLQDYENMVKCAHICIEAGEKSNIVLHAAISYGALSQLCAAMNDIEQATELNRLFLTLCYENGINEYFRSITYGKALLTFAYENGIEPDITKHFMEFANYKVPKIYIQSFGPFKVFSYNDRQNTYKLRTRKERELLAYLLLAGNEGATKEQIFQAIWSESESEDVKKLIGVNISHLKKDLINIGIEDPIVFVDKRYSISTEEIECDFDLLENKCIEVVSSNSSDTIKEISDLYNGVFLSDFEADWTIPLRMKYNDLYKKTVSKFNGNS